MSRTPDRKKIVAFLRDMLPEFMGHEKYDMLKAWHHYAAAEIEAQDMLLREMGETLNLTDEFLRSHFDISAEGETMLTDILTKYREMTK